ncbi:hypothetical protein EII20_02460 [Comamonadaceae bacterium OH2545_COT-014]|nr:hypothetical protein EII20_02460 [Comamonadaceae bacterium OH2545_COT-014]
MKLRIAPAREGIDWARQGVRTFFRQPLAMAGLLFMLTAALALVSQLPAIGPALALALLPAGTVGLMAATREASAGRFPMPALLAVALRGDAARVRAMLALGALYALGGLAVGALGLLLAPPPPALTLPAGGAITPEMLQDPALREALRATMRANFIQWLLYLPLSLLFWHAPALVHWHGVPPVKSLFFSAVAVLRNLRAFLLYGLAWLAISVSASLALLMLGALLGNPRLAAAGVLPVGMLIAAMLFASLWFTFRGCFDDAGNSRTAPPEPFSAP